MRHVPAIRAVDRPAGTAGAGNNPRGELCTAHRAHAAGGGREGVLALQAAHEDAGGLRVQAQIHHEHLARGVGARRLARELEAEEGLAGATLVVGEGEAVHTRHGWVQMGGDGGRERVGREGPAHCRGNGIAH